MFKKMLIYFSALVFLPALIYASASDYMILQDILPYKLFTGISGRVFSGPPSKYSQTNTGGLLDAAGHFAEGDTSYKVSYTEPGGKWPFVKVEVTQHAGSDPDKWLVHEVERDFRNYYGLPGDSYVIRIINGNTIMAAGSGGWDYRWVSGFKVVHIEYIDLQMTKPEPFEVVQAYLVKYPSTLTSMTSADLRTASNKTTWIKDEMDRRLWLCDKWFYQLQAGNVEQKKVLQESVKSMNIFLDYREKYFGIKAAEEKNILVGYLVQNDSANIQAKLTAYKTWWTVNKGNSITLP